MAGWWTGWDWWSSASGSAGSWQGWHGDWWGEAEAGARWEEEAGGGAPPPEAGVGGGDPHQKKRPPPELVAKFGRGAFAMPGQFVTVLNWPANRQDYPEQDGTDAERSWAALEESAWEDGCVLHLRDRRGTRGKRAGRSINLTLKGVAALQVFHHLWKVSRSLFGAARMAKAPCHCQVFCGRTILSNRAMGL